MFINIQFPSDTQKGHLRRAIRSQAALSSADCRKSTIAAKASTNPNAPEEVNKVSRARRRSKAKAIKDEPEASSSSLSTISSNNSSLSSISNHSSASSASSSPPESIVFPLDLQLGQWNTQYDPFLTLPSADAWHPSIPHLVYFAPDVQDPIYQSNRPVLRKELWPETLSHNALFFTSLLIASCHPSFAQERSPDIVVWFRHQAMRNIQTALDSAAGFNTSDQLIAAVCLICGWEFQFGDENSAKAHMAGLRTMINLRGGFHDVNLQPIVRQLLTFVTYDQLWYAGMDPVFIPQELKSRYETAVGSLDLPEGFAKFVTPKQICLIAPSTLGLIAEINLIMKRTRHRTYALLDVQSRLAEYYFLDNVTSNFSPINSAADDTIVVQAETHIKLALLCLISHLQGVECDNYWTLSEFPVPTVLINTVYAEIGVWSLFLICSTTPMPSPILLDGLEKLVSSLSITNWSLAEQTLRQYLYPSDSIDIASKILWNQMMPNQAILFEHNNLSRFHVATFRRGKEPLV
ncbi:hypothetical protein D6D13_03934 [Aureobasidium pullulans]|uniref:Transcription factor domain-containing protein n=1 Tax=Aureobasidium pullulans TaxID=5580 RepID=A0A4S9CZ47_AURPU|nr:hypothetical protein D6D13_03934 [Aureobasidium pullulans]